MAKRTSRRRSDRTDRLGASKSESTLLVLFIPSHDRDGRAIDQGRWVRRVLEVLGELFGGATAFPQGRGVWRDDDRGGMLVYDEPVIVQCYTNEAALARHAGALRQLVVAMGTETNQGAVGLVVDRDYLEIRLPLSETEPRRSRAARKGG